MEQVLELGLEMLVPAKQNPRGGDVGDVAELAASIKEVGVVEPLIVTFNSFDKYDIVAGHRRHAAARVAGLKTVPAIVRSFENERTMLTTMLVENLHRVDLSPLQEAQGFQQLADLKYSQREIAAKVGRSQSHIAKRLALLKLSDHARKTFESGGITAEDAVQLAALPAALQDRVLKEITWGTVESRIRELKWRDEEKARRAAEAKKPKPKVAVQPTHRTGNSKAEQERRAKEAQLRSEAAAARAKYILRLLSRGERELQYAAAVLVEACDYGLDWEGATVLLKFKRGGRSMSQSQALIAHASKSKKAAIDTLLALAIATAESGLRDDYGGEEAIARLHITRLQKVGYKPTEHDQALLKAKRR